MRFVIITAQTYEELCENLNNAVIGSGKTVDVRLDNGVYKALIDMYPTHVVTNEDLFLEVEENKKITSKVVKSA